MSDPYSRIPAYFPRLDVQEANTRKLLKSSLIRRIAEAQNFLWSRGRVHAAGGYEGNGPIVVNNDDAINVELMPDGGTARCVSTFLVPSNWNKKNSVKLNFQHNLSTNGVGTIYVLLEDTNGALLDWGSSTVSTSGVQTSTMTMPTPVSGQYQIRVCISFDPSLILGSSVAPAGTYQFALLSISARYEEDDSVDSEWFEFPTDFFEDNFPVSAVFLHKLIRNTLHLWGTRTPEICQSYFGPNYSNTSTFLQIGYYKPRISDKINEVSGQLVVNCTHGGAGNEVRLLVNGVVQQTWTALAAGYTTLTVTPFDPTVAAGGEEVEFTIEAKSTAASADWGTIVLGVQLWESGFNMVDAAPSGYSPLDFGALEGDDTITAQSLNLFSQSAGIRKLFNNDKWLAENKLRTLVGDWRHYVLKRGTEFSSVGSQDYDPRCDWTRGDSSQLLNNRKKNITVMYQSGDESVDALTTYPDGKADAFTGYNESTPYSYPVSLTYNGHGARLSLINIFKMFTDVETDPKLELSVRSRRAAPYLMANDGTGTGPLSADPVYANKAFLAAVSSGTSYLIYYPRIENNQRDDKNPFWLPSATLEGATAPFDFSLSGRLLPQSEGLLTPDGIGPDRPEGMLFEVELCSLYLADVPLSEASLKDLF